MKELRRDAWFHSICDEPFPHLPQVTGLQGVSDSYITGSSNATCQSSGMIHAPSQRKLSRENTFLFAFWCSPWRSKKEQHHPHWSRADTQGKNCLAYTSVNQCQECCGRGPSQEIKMISQVKILWSCSSQGLLHRCYPLLNSCQHSLY